MSGIAIVPFRRELAADFRRLNLEWIERLFSVEEPDRRVLEDPEGSIVAKGGTLFFAVDDANGSAFVTRKRTLPTTRARTSSWNCQSGNREVR